MIASVLEKSDETPPEDAMTATDVDVPVLHLVEPLPGFRGLEKYALIALDDEGSIFDLRSVDVDSVRFVVVPSVVFFPDYAPEISDASARMLELTEADDALLLVIVTVGESLATSTANLMAPLIINRHSLRAAQVILEGQEYPLRATLAH